MILKNIRNQLVSMNIQSPSNSKNLSISPSFLQNIKNIKHTYSVKRKKFEKKEDIATIKINPNTNTKFLNIINNNNYNEINDINTTTIYSNGKFRNIKQKCKKNIRNKLFEKNIVLSNNYINYKLNKKLSLKLTSNNKNNFYNKWNGLNISSHYIGNTKDNKFGIITNKLYVNKNGILTCSQNNINLKQNYNTASINDERNNNKQNKEFRKINIPNHNCFFNGIITTNFFPRIKNINNEKLYQKLMEQMTLVFNNKVKKKSNEKTISYSNSDYFRKNINNIKQQKLFNYQYKESENNNNNNIFLPIKF